MDRQPPKTALRFLRWFCHEDHLEEIEGNLIELFEQASSDHTRRANRLFYWNVLLHFRPDYIKSLNPQLLNHLDMYKSYFKIAWRSMLKQKLYSAINISGLAAGLTCFMLIYLYVQHEQTYDANLENAEQIYRVFQKAPGGEYMGTDQYAYTTVGLAPAMMENYPEVQHATTLYPTAGLLSTEAANYYEKGIWGDAQFFEVFHLPFLFGDAQSVLSRESSIVLTESLARKIFGKSNVVGESLVFREGDTPYTVSGIIEDLPTNSTISYSFVLSIQSMGQYAREMKENRWNNNDYHTFFTLAEGGSIPTLEKKLHRLLENTWPDYQERNFSFFYKAQPLADVHFESKVNFDIGLKSNRRFVSLFSLIAVLVLLLACVNYMSLAIARSIKRANEVGLRKVVGARRGQLIGQFLGESTLIAGLSLVLALILTYYLLPVFSYLIDRPLALSWEQHAYLIPLLAALVFVVGLISGSYPALLISALRPVQVLKGKIDGRLSGLRTQRWLTIGQYAVSIALIIGSMVIYRQFQFIQNKELGYDKEQIVTVQIRDRKVREKIDEIKAEWLRNPQISGVSTAMELPANVTSGAGARREDQAEDEGFMIYRARVDEDYIDVFGLELIAGRNFSLDIPSDLEAGRIINETAAKKMGWTPQEAVGKTLMQREAKKIVGVIKDFHMHSMHAEIGPLMLEMRNEYFDFISAKIQSENVAETLDFMQENLAEHSNYPFEFQFLDERFASLYEEDQRLGEMLGFFTLLSILIATMGLFGLAAFTTRQRAREISIRKVLGAPVAGLVNLLSRDFLKMVLVGFVLAVPLAWYAMSYWLQDFAYRIDLEWWMFGLAGLAVMLLAAATVSIQSLQVALTNPAEAIKSE